MKVQVTEIVPMPGSAAPLITSTTDNIFEVDRWETDKDENLVLWRGSQQVASFRHWINVREITEDNTPAGVPA